jgi:purine-binding chemotaxis protein CheW
MEATHSIQSADPRTMFLTFRLGDNVLGLAMQDVSEIVRSASTTPVPLTPAWVQGVFNLRGRVLPAVDLAVRLGLPPVTPSKRTCLLVLEMRVEGLEFSAGILVDEVCDLLELRETEIERPPTFGAGIKVEFLRGVYQRAERPLLMLDVVRVFRDDELMQIALTEQRLRTETERAKLAAQSAKTKASAALADDAEHLDWAAAEASLDNCVQLFDEE